MSQTEQILKHLKSGNPITPLDALREYGCFRLGARIWDLKKDGHNIISKMIEVGNGKHVKQYRLG